jgi:glycosyltransferase involved in cell wall biosynthesis
VEDGLPVTRHWRPPTSRFEARGFEQYLTHVPFSYLSLRLGDDDLAQAFFVTDALAAARWTHKTGRPSILTYTGIPDHSGLVSRRLRLDATIRAVEGCSATVAVSRYAASAFKQWLGVDARVIHPPVSLSAFTVASRRSEHPSVFCAAPLDVDRKRVALLVEAFELVREARSQAELVLLRPADPAACDRLTNGRPWLRFVDAVEQPAHLARYYGDAWVSALPSIQDSFGQVLVESLACGTPVVGSDRDAIPEVIDRDEIGRRFNGGPPELARALLETFELAEDPATVSACRRRAEDFSTERCVAAYEDLYRELLGR